MQPQPTKRCTLCDTHKPLAEFHRDKSRRDGHRDRCKACILAYNRRWYEADREAIIGRQMAAYRANPEPKIAYARAWYRRTHKEQLAYRAAYRATHQDEIKADRERRNVSGYFARKAAEWRKRYPQRAAAAKQRAEMIRRARKRQTAIEPVNTDAIIARDRSVCGICGKRVPPSEMSFDHIIPLSRGGAHAEWNLQVAHRRCNGKRGAGRTPGQPRLPF